MMWALALISSLEVSTPRAFRPSISSKSTSRSITTPLPMIGVLVGLRMPDGSRCRAYFSPLTTSVCPALFPPE